MLVILHQIKTFKLFHFSVVIGEIVQKGEMIQKGVISIFAMFLVFSLFLGQIRQFPEEPGLIGLHVNVVNNDNNRVEDLRVEVVIYTLGKSRTSDRFDIEGREKASETLYFHMPRYYYPGWYFARITLLEDDKGVVDVDYRYVNVI